MNYWITLLHAFLSSLRFCLLSSYSLTMLLCLSTAIETLNLHKSNVHSADFIPSSRTPKQEYKMCTFFLLLDIPCIFLRLMNDLDSATDVKITQKDKMIPRDEKSFIDVNVARHKKRSGAPSAATAWVKRWKLVFFIECDHKKCVD